MAGTYQLQDVAVIISVKTAMNRFGTSSGKCTALLGLALPCLSHCSKGALGFRAHERALTKARNKRVYVNHVWCLKFHSVVTCRSCAVLTV